MNHNPPHWSVKQAHLELHGFRMYECLTHNLLTGRPRIKRGHKFGEATLAMGSSDWEITRGGFLHDYKPMEVNCLHWDALPWELIEQFVNTAS